MENNTKNWQWSDFYDCEEDFIRELISDAHKVLNITGSLPNDMSLESLKEEYEFICHQVIDIPISIPTSNTIKDKEKSIRGLTKA